jgi:hypothetical protein
MHLQKELITEYWVFDLNDDIYDSVEKVRKGVIKKVLFKISFLLSIRMKIIM